MPDTLIDLSPDACAFIHFAVMQARAQAYEDIEFWRENESPEVQQQADSETFQAGVRIATADKLLEVLKLAVCISVTLPGK